MRHHTCRVVPRSGAAVEFRVAAVVAWSTGSNCVNRTNVQQQHQIVTIQRQHGCVCMYRESGASNASPDHNQEDAVLLSLVRQGDESAMAAIFDRYSKVVYSVALRVLRDPASAEDVLQEIFLQIWRNPDGFIATRGTLGGWLAVVSRNRSIDTLRRKRPSEQVDEMLLPSTYNLADEAVRNGMIDKARVVIHKLPAEQRKTLEMAFFDGMTHSEIAELTGDPLGTVKTRIRSALLTLRKALQA